jgi:hypothetical protein
MIVIQHGNVYLRTVPERPFGTVWDLGTQAVVTLWEVVRQVQCFDLALHRLKWVYLSSSMAYHHLCRAWHVIRRTGRDATGNSPRSRILADHPLRAYLGRSTARKDSA